MERRNVLLAASYPDFSLSMKMCAQRKAGRRQPSVPFPWSLAARYQSLASTLRKTKRLRRRLFFSHGSDHGRGVLD